MEIMWRYLKVTFSVSGGFPGNREEPPEEPYVDVESVMTSDGRDVSDALAPCEWDALIQACEESYSPEPEVDMDYTPEDLNGGLTDAELAELMAEMDKERRL